MKIRLTNNTLRIRVRKSDLAELEASGSTRETLTFSPDQQLVFSLERTEAEGITANLEAARIRIGIPTPQADQWIHTDQVALEYNGPSGLHLLIEKDFPCSHKPTTDREDTFHELKGKG